MQWNENLPDVSDWTPRAHRSNSLGQGLMMSCHAAQARIISQAEVEIGFNIDSYDSGLGIEDLVREELVKFLPDRYSIDAGVVNDRDGLTAGDFDILIRNGAWAPVTKLGATSSSRRFHYPVESLYSALEVKQTLGIGQLDDAMKKLVMAGRLNRPVNPYGHITENQHLIDFDREGNVLNPLHTAVFGVRLAPRVEFQDLALRFGEINALLNRDEMVTTLCVLGHGIAEYYVKTGERTYIDADFMRDRQKAICLTIDVNEPEGVFYKFYSALFAHLNRSVLGLQHIVRDYGESRRKFVVHRFDGAIYNEGAG